MNKFNYIIEFSDDIQKQVASDLKHKLMKSFNNISNLQINNDYFKVISYVDCLEILRE